MRLFSGYALTLWRPWDWCILFAGKDVENRDWEPTPRVVGRYIAIHAGKGWDAEGADSLKALGWALPDEEDWPAGRVVGAVQVVGWARASESPWYRQEALAWQLRDPLLLNEPVTSRGWRKLWKLPGPVHVSVAGQLRRGEFRSLSGQLEFA